jgi:hypothetical protein
MTVVACGGSATTETTSPAPASDAEMSAFCEAYHSVSELSWDEMTAALIEVSPAEIRAEMVRTSQPPGETWAEDKQAVEDFIERCEDL